MRAKSLLLLSMVFAVVLASGCLFESTEVTPANLPRDREGKSSTFEVNALSKCVPNNMVFGYVNTGGSRIDFPIVFVDSVRCKTAPIVYPGEGYWASCPHPDYPDSLKEDFVDGRSYTVRIEAMTNSDTVTCDFDAWIPQ